MIVIPFTTKPWACFNGTLQLSRPGGWELHADWLGRMTLRPRAPAAVSNVYLCCSGWSCIL